MEKEFIIHFGINDLKYKKIDKEKLEAFLNYNLRTKINIPQTANLFEKQKKNM